MVLVSISLVLDLDRVPKRWKDADASISPSRAEKNPRKSAFLSGCSCDPVPVPVLVPSALPPQHPADQERETRRGDTRHDAIYICNLQKSSWRPPGINF